MNTVPAQDMITSLNANQSESEFKKAEDVI